MSFKFNYKSTEDMNPFKVISDGEGYFLVTQVEEKTSKVGNEMLVLTMRLQNERGEQTLYMNYILQNEYTADNLYRLCDAANKIDLYTSSKGEIDLPKLLGLKGRCVIETVSDSRYGDKSVLKKYIPYASKKPEAVAPVASADSIDDQDIPF